MVPEEVGVVDGVYKGLTSAHAQKKFILIPKAMQSVWICLKGK